MEVTRGEGHEARVVGLMSHSTTTILISTATPSSTSQLARALHALQFGSVNLTSAGESDAFLIKLSAAGSLVWAVSVGGPKQDIGTAVATDALGNSYVTGTFIDTAQFGSFTL